jgi:predicted HTH domain antitoxin
MIVTVEIPDAVARQMHLDGPEAQRRTLVRLAVDGYRVGELSRGQVSELLDLSLWETEALLKEHGSGLGMTFEQYEKDFAEARTRFGI